MPDTFALVFNGMKFYRSIKSRTSLRQGKAANNRKKVFLEIYDRAGLYIYIYMHARVHVKALHEFGQTCPSNIWYASVAPTYRSNFVSTKMFLAMRILLLSSEVLTNRDKGRRIVQEVK